MRDSDTVYILRDSSWRTDGRSQGLAGLGERVAGLEWMAQEHVLEALADPDPRVRVSVAGMLKRTDPAAAMAEQATKDVVEAAYPTGKPVIFKRFAQDVAGRVRAAEAVAAQEITHPDDTLVNIIENADSPEVAAEKYMEMKVLQAMDPGSFSDDQIDEMFGEDGLLGKSLFKKITKSVSKVVKKVGKVVPKPIRKVIGNVLKVTPIGLVATVAKKTFIDAPKKAKKEFKAAEKQAAAAQAEYDAAYNASQEAMTAPSGPTPEDLAAAQAQQEAYNQAYAAAVQAASGGSGYTTPQPTWSAPSSGGGGGESAPAEEAAAVPAAAPVEEKSGGMAAAALAAAAGIGLLLLNKGKK